MAVLSGNKLLPIIAVAVVTLVVFVGVKTFRSDAPPTDISGPVALTQLPSTPSPDADSPAETVRALSAQVTDVRNTVKSIEEKNKEILTQKEDIRRDLQAQQTAELQRQGTENHSMLQSLRDEINGITAQLASVTGSRTRPAPSASASAGGSDIPPGFGYDTTEPTDTLVWIKPLDYDSQDSTLGTTENFLQKASLKTVAAGSEAKRLLNQQPVPGLGAVNPDDDHTADKPSSHTRTDEESLDRRYTVPRNATLMESTAFTALIGRVPVKGEVKDPVPFKVLVGAKNLAANGLEAPPELEGMVFSGVAIGDFTLHCATGRLTSVTFVFADGTIRTESGSEHEPLGTISDRQGIPCISGELISNAPIYLAERVGAMGLEVAGDAVAATQTQQYLNAAGGMTNVITGSMGKYVMGKTVAGGASELRQWLDERQQQSFDAVFVQPGVELALHIDKELHIDYDPNGRKLRHDKNERAPAFRAGLD